MVFHHSRSSAYIKWQQDWNNTLLQSNNKNQKSVRARVCLGNEIGNWGISAKTGSWNKNFIEHERSGEGLLAQGRSSGGDQMLLCGEESVWRLTSWLGLWRQRAEQALPSAPVCSALVMDPPDSVRFVSVQWEWGLAAFTVHDESKHVTSQGSQTPSLFKEQTLPTGCEMLGEPGSGVPPFQPTWCPPLGPPPSASLGGWSSWPCLQNKSPLGTEWEVAMIGNSECLSHREQWGTPAAQFRALSDFINVFFFQDRGMFVKFASNGESRFLKFLTLGFSI